MKLIVAALLLVPRLLCAQAAVAAPDSVRRTIQLAVEHDEPTEVAAALALAERASAADPSSRLLRHYLGYALYRMGTVALAREGSGKARSFVERSRDVLEKLAADSAAPVLPETFGLLSAVYGLQIATSRVPMVAAMRFGPRSNEWMARAMKAAPENPRLYVIRGIGAFNTPSTFGGGLDKAEADFKRALELFTRDNPAPGLPTWGRAEAHLWLGQVYARQRRVELARAEYEAALALEPNNAWIRRDLLPQLAKAR